MRCRARLVFNDPLNGLTGNDSQGMRRRASTVGFTSVDDRSFGDIYRRYFGAESESDAAELFRLAVAEG